MTSVNKKLNLFEEAKLLMQAGGERKEVKNKFFINKIFSYNKVSILQSININKYLSLPQWATDALFHFVIPKSNAYLMYINKDKKTEDPVLLKKICIFFGTNDFHSKQIIKLLEKNKVDPKRMFGIK